MAGIVDEALIKCPYYLGQWKDSHGRINVSCEGIVEGTASINSRFAGKQEFESFAKKKCCGDYKRCPLADLLEKKYK